ncbi:MAG TPA: hypothetical protein VKT32_00655 [Chthonomonadaceae bacterium]|nr:hypothetical protein [Chthonomonadaceae bacterium]
MPTYKVTAPEGMEFARVTANSPHEARQLILAELGKGPTPPLDATGQPIGGQILSWNESLRAAAAASDEGFTYTEESQPDSSACVVRYRLDGSSRLVLLPEPEPDRSQTLPQNEKTDHPG